MEASYSYSRMVMDHGNVTASHTHIISGNASNMDHGHAVSGTAASGGASHTHGYHRFAGINSVSGHTHSTTPGGSASATVSISGSTGSVSSGGSFSDTSSSGGSHSHSISGLSVSSAGSHRHTLDTTDQAMVTILDRSH